MFECKLKDNDIRYKGMPGWIIWNAMQGLAMSQCALHRRNLEVKPEDEARAVETSAGRVGNAHWDSYAKSYNSKGYAGFCLKCDSAMCPLNRNHICRILILYNLITKLHMHYQSDLYVTDLGVNHSDAQRFINTFVRRTIEGGRFGKVTHQTIPAFRDFSESVYAGDNIDLALVARPNLE